MPPKIQLFFNAVRPHQALNQLVVNAIVQAEERKRSLPPAEEYYSQMKKTPESGKLPGLAWFLHETRGLVACGTAKHPIPPEQATKIPFEELVQTVVKEIEKMAAMS